MIEEWKIAANLCNTCYYYVDIFYKGVIEYGVCKALMSSGAVGITTSGVDNLGM